MLGVEQHRTQIQIAMRIAFLYFPFAAAKTFSVSRIARAPARFILVPKIVKTVKRTLVLSVFLRLIFELAVGVVFCKFSKNIQRKCSRLVDPLYPTVVYCWSSGTLLSLQ